MGFDSSRFTDLPPFLEEELTCTICYCILCKAVVTTCGHAFCRECILTWFQQEKSCPVCRKFIGKVCKPPVIISNLLSRLRLVCAFKEKGCSEILSLDQVERHEAVCKFRVRHSIIRSIFKFVLPPFLNLLTGNTSHVHSEYDGEDAEDDFDLMTRSREIDVTPPFPIIFAVTAAGILYKSFRVLFDN